MRQIKAAEAVIAELERPGAPGGAAGVVVGGELVWSRGFGLADLGAGRAFTADTPFHICSITKTFTAVLLGLLEADGLLSFDDELRRRLPQVPDYGTPLTLRHLVTNTAGLRDYFPLMWLERGTMPGAYPREPMERHALSQPSLMFAPGGRYSYSNSNFVALCRVMEKVSGKPYADLVRERVLAPLGMDRSEFRTQTIPEPEGAALGYFEDGEGFRAPRLDVHEAGDGGLWSTANDLARYGAALASGALGPKGMVGRLTAPTVLTNGDVNWYGCGFGTGEHGGARWFGHAGGLAGMSTNLACFPGHDAAVVTAFNGPGEAEELGFRLADIFLGLTQAPRTARRAEASLEGWASCWQDEGAGQTAQIVVEDGQARLWLLGWDIPLTPVAEDLLVDPESESQVRRVSPDAIEVRAGRGGRVTLKRLAPGQSPPPEGRFEGVEVRAVYEIAGGALTVHGEAGASPAFPLAPLAANVWRLGAGAVVTLSPDGDLIVSMSKAERVRLRRIS